ncbi:uncharacterized protein LOC104456847 [Eucalyptus grandis]|uniref:uncharacterized protein LOC104456847 n=1 Tax=Eucalyptus grandis TaxID=71139 RepID=UPI00192EFAF6|nr:uncharacterized protein LOC104456847 [Eucalyptus grandis]
MPPMSHVVRTLLIVLSVSASAAASRHPSCKYVDEYFPDCLDYLVGTYFIPPEECCNSVGVLNYMAIHLMGPRVICQCIEARVMGTNPPLMPSRIEALPKYCGTHLSFPISSAMDCSRGDEFTFCVDVYQHFANCIGFLEGLAPEPPRACCNNLLTLNDLAKQNQFGPELLCRCIEDIGYVMDAPFVPSRIENLRGECQVHLSFPISNAMNCSM